MIKTLWIYETGWLCLPYFILLKIITFLLLLLLSKWFCVLASAQTYSKSLNTKHFGIILNLNDEHGFVIIHLCTRIFDEMHIATRNQIDNHSQHRQSFHEMKTNTNQPNGKKISFPDFLTAAFPSYTIIYKPFSNPFEQ